MDRIILSDPHHGLCNKLRNFICSMKMASFLDAKLVVRWVPWDCCGAYFNHLFKNEYELDDGHETGRSVVNQINLEYIDPCLLEKYDIVKVGGHKPFSFEPEIQAWTSDFWNGVRPFFYKLQPVDEVSQLVNDVANEVGENTVGVHIRRGDHSVAHNVSKYELFVEEMKEQRGANFYVATECQDILNKLVDIFGNRIIKIDDYCDVKFRSIRNCHHAIRVALAEMLLLSKTSKIIGSARSSFSTFPAIMAGIPFKRMGSREHYADDHYIDMHKEDLVEVPCH